SNNKNITLSDSQAMRRNKAMLSRPSFLKHELIAKKNLSGLGDLFAQMNEEERAEFAQAYLMQAITENDEDILDFLLIFIRDIHFKGPFPSTGYLEYAIDSENYSAAQKIIDERANPDVYSEKTYTNK